MRWTCRPEDKESESLAMSVLTDPSTYPISAAAARQLDRPLFGHVDRRRGRAVARRRARCRSIDPATGEQVATAAAGSARRRRARRPVRARGVRRRPLALPGAARAGAAAAQARRADRRARRRARRARRHRLRACCGSTPASSSSSRSTASSTTPAGPRSCTGSDPRRAARVRRLPGARAARRRRGDHAVERADGRARRWRTFALCAGNSVVLKPAEQTPMTAVAHRRAGARGGDPARRVQRRPGHRRDRRARRSSRTRRSTRSRSPARARPAARSRPRAAARVKRVSLELGGKSPSIIFPDADLEAAVRGGDGRRVGRVGPGLHVRHARAGPRERPRRGRRARSSSGRAGMRIGGGFDPDAEMGPVVSAEQLERIQRYVAIGQRRGRRARARRRAPRRARLLPRADGLHRRAQRHDDRPGGDLRAGDVGAAVLLRGGGLPHRQRRRVRARRRRVDERPRARAPRDAARCASAPSGSTRTRWSTRRCPTAASSSPATAATSARRRSTSSRRPRASG